MKERPILFSTPMVKANLAGLKTQTRRIMKIQPIVDQEGHFIVGDRNYGTDGHGNPVTKDYIRFNCPYGIVGDQLWVKETFYSYGKWEWRHNENKQRKETYFVDMTLEMDRLYQYAAEPLQMTPEVVKTNKLGWYKRPSIFMPRKASRIQLEITGIRVERLQDISETDAWAEGVNAEEVLQIPASEAASAVYSALWEQINGSGTWDTNPWVWVVEYKIINRLTEASA